MNKSGEQQFGNEENAAKKKKKQTKEEMKMTLEEHVYMARRSIIKGDIDLAVREISDSITKA
jgi:hypothetical protein